MRRLLASLAIAATTLASGCTAEIERTPYGYEVHAGGLLWGLFFVLVVAGWLRGRP